MQGTSAAWLERSRVERDARLQTNFSTSSQAPTGGIGAGTSYTASVTSSTSIERHTR